MLNSPIRLLALCVISAVAALASSTSCASSTGAVGCVRVDAGFSNPADPPITVNNFSFENPSVSAGGYTQQAGACSSPCVPGGFPDWTLNAQLGDFVGVFNPTTTYVSAGSSPSGTDVPDGVQVAYISTGGGVASISQDTNVVVEADTTYSLTVFLGARLDAVPLPASYGIELFDFNTSTVFAPTNCVAPGAGAFVSCTISFDTAALVSAIGGELGIGLFANDGSSGEILFDNVQLGFVSDTPEPGSIGLLAAGLTLIGVALRRRATSRG